MEDALIEVAEDVIEQPDQGETDTRSSTNVFESESEGTKEIGVKEYIKLICAIPEEYLSRWSDMDQYLNVTTGDEINRSKKLTWPKGLEDGRSIPYWRVVT